MPAVLGIRANDELQAKFKSFVEEGDFTNQSDFLNHLLTLYAAQNVSGRVPTLEGAISAVSELTDRINKVLIGAGETIIVNQEKERAQLGALQEEAKQKVTDITAENENLKTEILNLKLVTEIKEKELSELKESNERLNFNLDDRLCLQKKLREDIANLENEISLQRFSVSEAEESKTKYIELQEQFEKQKIKIQEIEMSKKDALIDLEKKLRDEMNEQQTLHSKKINEYELQIQQAEINKEKALIDLEKKLRDEMSEQQILYSKKVSEYESKVLSYIEQYENLKTKIEKQSEG